MIQCIGLLSRRRCPGSLSTLAEGRSIFELSQLTGTATKCMDEWLAAD